MIPLCLLLAFADPPKEPPSVETARNALKKNVESPHRRIKHVVIQSPGEPRADFPPIDSPDRDEIERIIAADGRIRVTDTVFQSGTAAFVRDISFDGSLWVRLEGRSHSDQTVHFHATIAKQYDRNLLRSNMFGEGLHLHLGTRSSLVWSPIDRSILLVNPRVDDSATHRQTYELDTKRNYWPISEQSESRNDDGSWRKDVVTRVVEFLESAGNVYPKRMTSWRKNLRGTKLNGQETTYTSVVKLECPAEFKDDVFRITIPDGATVEDWINGKRFTQGQPEPAAAPSKTEVSVFPETTRMMINLAFLLVIVVAAAGARYLIMQRFPPPPGKQ